MSGLLGVVHCSGQPVSAQELVGLCQPLRAGASGEPEIWADGIAGFGFARLKTEGPEGGIATLDGSAWIVADARLDAREDLRRELGVPAGTDAELILHGYQRWGAGCVDRLAGDFSFAIWNRAERTLFCARDHFGVKPFLYAATRESLVFSNSVDALAAHPRISHAYNDRALADFLLFGYSLDPADTAFEDMKRLPAAHTLTWRAGTLAIQRYWTLPVEEPLRLRRSQDYVEGFNEVLDRAVADRAVPGTAMMMSGGLDSTMVAAAAKPYSALKAFTIVYDRLIPDQERRYAKLAASHLNIPMGFLAADDYRLFEDHPATGEPADEPLFKIFLDHLRQVSEYSSVALTGVGGDPLLLPNPNLASAMLARGAFGALASGMARFVALRGSLPPVGLRSAFKRAAGANQPQPEPLPTWVNPEIEASLNLKDRWADYEARQASDASPHPFRPNAYKSLADPFWAHFLEGYHPQFTRTPVDVRHPLFDLRLVKYCLRMPSLPWCVDKTLAREAMRGKLPEPVRLRPKSAVPGDPIGIRMRQGSFLQGWDPHPELHRFIERGSLRELAVQNGSSSTTKLRLFSLNCWLQYLTEREVKDTKEKYEKRERTA